MIMNSLTSPIHQLMNPATLPPGRTETLLFARARAFVPLRQSGFEFLGYLLMSRMCSLTNAVARRWDSHLRRDRIFQFPHRHLRSLNNIQSPVVRWISAISTWNFFFPPCSDRSANLTTSFGHSTLKINPVHIIITQIHYKYSWRCS